MWQRPFTAAPADALPKRSPGQIRNLQDESEFWWNSAFNWAHWASIDSANHDMEAYALDVHNELSSKARAKNADRELAACG